MELKRRNKVSADFSMASMTDIIFLLLIFFMITSSAISQSAIEVNLPKSETQDVNVQDPTTVTISKEGKFFVNDKEIAKQNVESYLVNLLKSTTNPTFTIRADEETKHKDVVFAMGIAEKHQFNLAIATTEK